MHKDVLSKAVALARNLGHVLLATTGPDGVPHLAAAGTIAAPDEHHLAVSDWFCPGTLDNLDHQRHIAIVVWDAPADHGWQLIGEVEQVRDTAVMDGYEGPDKPVATLPQVRQQLLVRVDKVLRFTAAPHSDIQE